MFRVRGVSLGGKLSLTCLFVASLFMLAEGGPTEWVLTVFGFPLLYAPWVAEQVFGKFKLPPPAGLSLFVLLWVGNAYLWGHTLAAVIRWWDRFVQAEERAATPPDPPANS
jgi:hypothetical protein